MLPDALVSWCHYAALVKWGKWDHGQHATQVLRGQGGQGSGPKEKTSPSAIIWHCPMQLLFLSRQTRGDHVLFNPLYRLLLH